MVKNSRLFQILYDFVKKNIDILPLMLALCFFVIFLELIIVERSYPFGFSVSSYEDLQLAKKSGNPYTRIEFKSDFTSKESFLKAIRAIKNINGVIGGTVRGSFNQRVIGFVRDKNLSLKELEFLLTEEHKLNPLGTYVLQSY